jgi:hypothetical protein
MASINYNKIVYIEQVFNWTFYKKEHFISDSQNI